MQAPAAIAILNGPEHRFTLANAEYCNLAQRDPVGKTIREAFPDLAGQGLYEMLDQVYETGEAIVGKEVPLQLGRDSHPYDGCYDFVYQPVTGPDGAVEGIFVHAVDVTDKVSARRALEGEIAVRARTQAVLAGERAILETIARGYPLTQTLDALARFIEERTEGAVCSILLLEGPASERRLRHGAAPSIPDTYNHAIDNIRIGPSVGSCGTAAYRGEPVIVTDIASDPLWADFRELALSHDLYACWSTPIQGTDGEILGTFALYYREPHAPEADERELVSVLTYLASIAIARHRKEEERVQILQREREAREAAEAAVRVRDEFLSIASHELRTPATVIKGITQLWQRAAQRGTLTPDRLAQQIVSIRRASDRLNILINDLLDVSRLQSGQFALRKESLDLAAFVRDIAERHAEGADDTKTIELHLPDSPVEADADPTRLEQILDNLLTNAVKYSPEGQSIRVSLQRDGDGAVISVRDQGIGLPAGAADRIFEPFGRAENAVKRNLPGMGLGLYICRRIAELHGGRLWAESAGEDRGTVLQLWLPRTSAAS